MHKTKLTIALMSTAAGVALSSAAFAQDTAFPQVTVEDGQNYLASDLMGRRVYGVEQDMEAGSTVAAGSSTEWDDIGEIGDFVLSADGTLEAVIIDVGGFLGIGEREVAIDWDSIHPVMEEGDAEDTFLTVNATEEQLENAPEFTRVTAEGMTDSDGQEMAATDGTAPADATAEENAENADVMAVDAEGEDPAAETAEAEMEETGDEVAEATDDAAENVEQAADATGEAVEDGAENVEQAADATGDEVQEEAGEIAEEMDAESTDATTATADATATTEGDAAAADTEVSADATATTEEPAETDMAADATATEEQPADAEMAADTTATAEQPADTTEMAASENMSPTDRAVLRTPAVEREGYETVGMDQLTVEDLTGARIYGVNDEDIGEVDDLLLSEDGKQIEGAIIGIGGFLGLGEHKIALTMDELQILRSDGDFRIYVDATQEELEAQPEYNEAG